MIIFEGNDRFAYRDPACCFFDGEYHLLFTVSELCGEYMYNRIGMSVSSDLKSWSEPVFLTKKDRELNFCSPGNIIKVGDEYVMCFTSYPMPFPYKQQYWADENARIFTMRTKDFRTFSEPELLNPKSGTPSEDIGRMIDPFIIKKDEYYYVFFKQNGVSFSRSRDLSFWEFLGNTEGGENACIIPYDGRYLLIHSPGNGIAFSVSDDLLHWSATGSTTLDQESSDWAKGRLTAAFAMEAKKDTGYKYILFYHGSKEVFPETHGNASLAIAFTNDFQSFVYKI